MDEVRSAVCPAAVGDLLAVDRQQQDRLGKAESQRRAVGARLSLEAGLPAILGRHRESGVDLEKDGSHGLLESLEVLIAKMTAELQPGIELGRQRPRAIEDADERILGD